MTDLVHARPAQPVAIPIREILPWLAFVALLSLAGLYFVGTEQGAAALVPGEWIHEFVHDGRHVLGYPCH
jgi:hypothetical protein